MSSELVVVLHCDDPHCNEIAVVKECATFVDYHEYSGRPIVALDYITPPGWHRVKGVSHYCPRHAEFRKRKKLTPFCLPNTQSSGNNTNNSETTTYFDTNDIFPEEPTQKINIIARPNNGNNNNNKKE